MSNSEPSAIVLHGIAGMRGIIHVFDPDGENRGATLRFFETQ